MMKDKKSIPYRNKLGQIISVDLQVMGALYDFELANEPCWFTRLVKFFVGNLTRSEISKAQDRLYDLGLLDMKYEMVGNLWTCCWKLTSEGKIFIEKIIN